MNQYRFVMIDYDIKFELAFFNFHFYFNSIDLKVVRAVIRIG